MADNEETETREHPPLSHEAALRLRNAWWDFEALRDAQSFGDQAQAMAALVKSFECLAELHPDWSTFTETIGRRHGDDESWQ